MTIWNAAAGDGKTTYMKFWADFGVFTAGPGEPWPELHKIDVDKDYKNSVFKRHSFLKPMIDGVKKGDKVLLRNGSTIYAIGEVTSERCDLEPRFVNVCGWDQQLFWEVRWKHLPINPKPDPKDKHRKRQWTTKELGLSNRRTLHKVGKKGVDRIKEVGLWENGEYRDEVEKQWTRTLRQDWEDTRYDKASFERDCEKGDWKKIEDVQQRCEWYKSHKGPFSEHDVRTFLTIPFLEALGWTHEKMRIEFEKKDIVLFKKPFTGNDDGENIHAIIETKSFNQGVRVGRDQLKGYVAETGKDKGIIGFTTNGIAWELFETFDDKTNPDDPLDLEKELKPDASSRIDMLYVEHPIYKADHGAERLLKALKPPK
jgi:hypothetical protein